MNRYVYHYNAEFRGFSITGIAQLEWRVVSQDDLEKLKGLISEYEGENKCLGIHSLSYLGREIEADSNQTDRKLIGWRASDYTDETTDPEIAKNWAAAIGVLPIFEGDVNTKIKVKS